MKLAELKEFLDEKVELYNNSDFIESDPIQIPHRFEIKEDIEISGFFSANMAWDNRKMIINKLNDLMNRMGNSPYDFVMNYSEESFERIDGFKHRTMNSVDIDFMLRSLQNIYFNHSGLESIFSFESEDEDSFNSLERFRTIFLEIPHEKRTAKHISSTQKCSAAKSINILQRWHVR